MTYPIPSRHNGSLTCWSNFITHHKYTGRGVGGGGKGRCLRGDTFATLRQFLLHLEWPKLNY